MPPKKKRSIKPLSINEGYVELEIARHWNILPWEFRTLTQDQKGELAAGYQVNREIEHYYNSESMRDTPSGGGGDTAQRRVRPKAH